MAQHVRRRILAAKLGASVVFLSVMSGLGLKPSADDAQAARGTGSSTKADEQARQLGLVLREFASAALLSTRENGISSRHIKNGSLLLKDFKHNQVFSFKQGQDLRKKWTHIELKVNDEAAEARRWWPKIDSQSFQLRQLEDESRRWWLKVGNNVERLGSLEGKAGTLEQKILKLESDVSAFKQGWPIKWQVADAATAGQATVVMASGEAADGAPTQIVEVPGFGTLTLHNEQGALSWSWGNSTEGQVAVVHEAGSGVIAPGKDMRVSARGIETMQIIPLVDGRPGRAVATLTLSTIEAVEQPAQGVAQILIAL